MNPSIDQRAWLDTLRDLLHYYVPPLEPSPALLFGGLAAVAVGLHLVFRTARSERLVVSAFAFLLGGWLGWQASAWTGAPGPISMAVVGVVFTVIAYRTYRYWLAGGSVIMLFCAALVFQLGRGDLQRYLPSPRQGGGVEGGVLKELPSAEQQLKNLHSQASEKLAMIKENLLADLKSLGPVGWLLPLAGGVVGAILAFWALRVFVVMWIGLIGATMAVIGGMVLTSAHWPELRSSVLSEPRGPVAVVAGLWLVGLIYQAKEARLPSKKGKTAEANGKPAPQAA